MKKMLGGLMGGTSLLHLLQGNSVFSFIGTLISLIRFSPVVIEYNS